MTAGEWPRGRPVSSYLVAKRSGVAVVGGVRHEIRAGETVWASSCRELRDPQARALFGLEAPAGRDRPPRGPAPDYLLPRPTWWID